MNKVLVDRELLERIAAERLRIEDTERVLNAAAELRPILAQPAEAEGVDFGFDDRSVKVSQEAYSIFLARERHHLAALSAVTAERDGLAAARMAYANEFAPDENGDPDVGNVHANIRALKAERDRLANAFGDCVNSLHAEMLQKYGGQLPEDMHPVTRRDYDRDMEEIAEYRAAMAAKEA